MATANEVITLAYREANFKNSVGVLTAEESAEGLTLLQSIVDSFFGLVVGTKLLPWFVPRPQKTAGTAANYPALPGDYSVVSAQAEALPPSNVRLMMKNLAPVTVWFQYQPEDGAVVEYVDTGHEADVTLDANGALFGLTGSTETVGITALFPTGRNTPRRWVYRADYGSWLEITALGLTSVVPFPSAFDDYFVTALAVRLSPRFGADPRQITLLRFQQMEVFLRNQYLQSKEVLVGTGGIPSLQSYGAGSRSGSFDTGGVV